MSDHSDGELSEDLEPCNTHWSQNAITFDTGELSTKAGDPTLKVRAFINGDSIMKITLVVMFVAEFARAIENVWVTALLMQYSVHPYFDCVVWSLPIFLSIGIKPYLQNYTGRFIVSVAKYIDEIFIFLLVGAAGHYLLTVSTYIETVINFAHFPLAFSVFSTLIQTARVLVATLGWTIVDVCLELVLTYNDNVKAYLIENKIASYVDSKMRKYEESMTVVAKLCGYLLSMAVCSAPYTFRNFHLQICNMYYVSGLMWINTAFFIKTVSVIRVSKGVDLFNKDVSLLVSFNKIGQTLRSVRPFSMETYFYGMEDTMKANFKLKMILAMFFCFNSLADFTEFYATVWMVMNLPTVKLTYAGIYTRGIGLGAFVLAASALITFAFKRRNRPSTITDMEGEHGKEAVPISFSYKFLVCIAINISATFYALLTGNIIVLWFVIGLEGWLRGMSQLYLEKRFEMLSKFYPQYQRCQEFVFTLQKLFVLLVMPLYCWFLQGARAAEGCLLTSLVLLLIMFAIQVGELIKTKKENSNLVGGAREKKMN